MALVNLGVPERVWALLKGPSLAERNLSRSEESARQTGTGLRSIQPISFSSTETAAQTKAPRSAQTRNEFRSSDGGWDLRVRSRIIHLLSPLGGDPRTIINRLDEEPDVTVRRALVLTLGEFSDVQLPAAERQPLVEKLLTVFEKEPDPGLHAAAEWLLRRWKQGDRVRGVLDKFSPKRPVARAGRHFDGLRAPFDRLRAERPDLVYQFPWANIRSSRRRRVPHGVAGSGTISRHG